MNICSNQSTMFAEIAANTRLRDRLGTLTYRVPSLLVDRINTGQLVWIPLRRKLALGVVVELHQRDPSPRFQAKDIQSLVEPEFCLTPIQWNLAAWIARETVCTFYEAASLMLPPGVTTNTVIHLMPSYLPDDNARESFTQPQLKLIDYLANHERVTLTAARKAMGSSLNSIIPALEERGVLRQEARIRTPGPAGRERLLHVRLLPENPPPPDRAPRQLEAYTWLSVRLRARENRALPIESVLNSGVVNRQTLNALADRGCIAIEPASLSSNGAGDASQPANVRLTREQQIVWEQLEQSRRANSCSNFLLHGVTGSGKTEIYFRSIAVALAARKSAILLVPEIGLAGQVIERARGRFGDSALILHSGLDNRSRYENWNRAASGEPVVVVGARSALFAPLPEIGVIILDEEHDAAYKQDSQPRYHARSVARRLAELHGARLFLGSATPDVESYYQSQSSDWTLLALRERIGQRAVDRSGDIRPRPIPLPGVQIIDMRQELKSGNHSIFSSALTSLIESRLAAGEQSILFLNRRGMSTVVQCRSCGQVSECPYCDIPLVYHRTSGRMICHRCGHRDRPPAQCPVCGSASIGYYGSGTQRVEREIASLFPSAQVMRWDQDALRGGVKHEQLLNRAQAEPVDIIVGTQMVAKGLDLPRVTAVGVVNADTYLHLPDFRSAERTFQMLSQVAGRAGRRSAGGKVIIQTFSPDHYSIISASRHDYAGFYGDEIDFRRWHGYPPYKRFVRLLYRHPHEEKAEHAAREAAGLIERYLIEHQSFTGIDIIGPAPAFAARVRGRYGWQLILRGDQAPTLLGELQLPWGWIIDVDPVNLL